MVMEIYELCQKTRKLQLYHFCYATYLIFKNKLYGFLNVHVMYVQKGLFTKLDYEFRTNWLIGMKSVQFNLVFSYINAVLVNVI